MEASDDEVQEQDDQILTKVIKVDGALKLSNSVSAIEDIIRGPENILTGKPRIEEQKLNELKKKVSIPNNYVFVEFASRIYKENGADENDRNLHGEIVEPSLGNWKLLTIARSFETLGQNIRRGYFGVAYWNPDMQQIIIIHHGIRNVQGIFTDSISLDKNAFQINSAITFTDIIINILRKISGQLEREGRIKPYVQLFFTGHSLGAWLAQITTFTAKYVERKGDDFVASKDFEKTGYHASAIVFDSPGCKSTLQHIQDRLMDRSSPSLINHLNITAYLSAPNLINASDLHVGDVYKVFINFSDYQESLDTPRKYTGFTHQIKKFKEVFNPVTGEVLKDEDGNLRMKKVIDWPSIVSRNEDSPHMDNVAGLISKAAGFLFPTSIIALGEAAYLAYTRPSELDNELKEFFELANRSNDFHLNEEVIKVKVGVNIYRSVRYKTEEISINYENESNVNVFTQSERQFLETYNLVIEYKDLPGVLSPEKLFSNVMDDQYIKEKSMKMLANYVIEDETVSANELSEFIPYIKRMLYIFPSLIKEIEKGYHLLPIDIRKGLYESASFLYLQSIDIPLEFKYDTLRLNDFLSSDAKIWHSAHSDTSVGIAIIHQIFKSFSNVKTASHAFLNEERIVCLGLTLLISFLNDTIGNYLLVIECSNVPDERMESLLANLFPVLEMKSQIKVIFVTKIDSKEQEFIAKFINESNLKKSSYILEKCIEVKLTDLTQRSRNELIKKKIVLQGKPISLRSILNQKNNPYIIIDPRIILGLDENESIEVGETLPTLDQNKNYYINRKLVRKIRIQKNAFEDEDIMDLFVISNTTKDELSKLVNVKKICNFSEVAEYETSFTRFVILDGENDAADFETLYSSFSPCNIHWLEKEEDNVYWKRSHGNLSYIRNYVDSDFENIFNIDSIEILNERFIIIAAEPGMGKSTLLTHLASKRMESEWFIRINLIECKNKLEKNIDFANVDNIIDFLYNSKGNILHSKLTKKLIKSHFDGSGDLVLFLDGFDEITLHGQESIKNLLKTLQGTKIKKVLISTRLHLKTDLEDILSTFAYGFQPFSEDDQEEFLYKFWQSTLYSDIEKSHINEESLNNYIDKLLELISHSMRDKEKKFMGIPLQMKMIAEAFQDGLKHALYLSQFNNENLFVPEEFDILELYNRFIQTKYQIYFGKIGVYIDLNEDIRETWLIPRIRLIHGSIAFNILFPEKSGNFLQGKLPSEAEKHAIKLIGIVQFINNEMVFIHRTFAEYFAADFLAENLKNEENLMVYKMTSTFLAKQLFEQKNEMVKVFLDYHLAKERIHIAAFKGKLKVVHDTTPEIAANTIDILGRSALHYAAQGEYKDIVEDLLTKGADPDAVDKLGKTALHYAARYNKDDSIINCLLEEANSCILVEDKNGCTPAEYAFEQCNWSILNRFIDKGKDFKILKQGVLYDSHSYQRASAAYYDEIYRIHKSKLARDSSRCHPNLQYEIQGFLDVYKHTEVKFNDLTQSLRNKLLRKKVIFQGIPTYLETILGKNNSDLDKIIDPETIVGLLKNESIEVGKALPTLGQSKNYYINRKLIRKVRIKENVFEDKDIMDLFVISNTTKAKLPQLINGEMVCNFSEGEYKTTSPTKCVVLDGKNDKTNFETLCTYFSQSNLHWLKRVGKMFIWKRSYGTLSYIRHYIDSDFENTTNIKTINSLKERFIIIAAEPGMGKSTIFTYLGSRRMRSEWIIQINLAEHKNKLEGNIEFANDDDIINFLHASDEKTFSSKLTKRLMKSRFNGSGDIVLLLDGFDEITLHGQENVKKLLKTVRETKIKKVIISTKLHLKTDLENILSTFAYAFRPFSKDNQKELLTKFWQSTLDSDSEKSHIDEESLNNYTDKLLEFISHSIHDEESKFMQIPLHIKMFAEAFQDGLKHALYLIQFNNFEMLFPEGFDIFKLYDRFIQTKYQIYFETMGVSIDLNDSIQNTLFTTELRQQHGSLAFNILYPEEKDDFLQDKLPSEDEKHAMKLIGIVHSINDELLFIHRPFVHYFMADFLAYQLRKKKDSKDYKIAFNFLEKQLFKRENEMVNVFLDYHLATEKIHVAALKGKLDDVRDTSPEIAAYTTDILGRSALHYAAQGEYETIINALLEKGANPAATDELGKTALHYSARYNRGKSVVICLLEKESSCLHVKDKNGCTPVVYAVEQSNRDIVKLLIKKDAHTTGLNQESKSLAYQRTSINANDSQGNTLLHTAAQKGKTATVNSLLEQNADVDAINKKGKKPMYYAAQNKHWGVVVSLLKKGTDFNELNPAQKISLFSYCVQNSHWEIITLFFLLGVNINQYLEHLTDQQKIDMLCFYISSGNLNFVESLAMQGTEINTADLHGKKPICYAAEKGYWNIVEVILQKGGNLLDLKKEEKISLMKFSAQNCHWNVFKLLMNDSDRDSSFDCLSD